ncbi:Zinc finger BED domain-containing protein RICESLEEPER 2 [Linum grandiflorum]
MDQNLGKIAVTTDLWRASNQRKGYMVVTGHYIENDWDMRNQLLRFCYLPAPHTADILASVLMECLMDWNIDSKISTITLDNCSTNDNIIDKWLQNRSLVQGGRLLDLHRSRLHHNTVEALMCTRSWLQNDMKTDRDANASQFMEGIFTLLEANDDVAEEEAEHEDQEEPMNIEGSIMEDID